jgi:hypothetical protein
MKDKIPYCNFPSFILRSPLFPFTFLDSLILKKNTTEDQLKAVCKRPEVQEAIFLGSPNLYTQMKIWLTGELKDPKEKARLPYSLMRYILRMSTRCTPFGLFAGFSVGKWGEETRVNLPGLSDYNRHTRLDMNYLCALALDLAKHPEIIGKIQYYPNSSIYKLGDQLRYVEYRYQNVRRTHHIVAVDHSEYLQRVMIKPPAGHF